MGDLNIDDEPVELKRVKAKIPRNNARTMMGVLACLSFFMALIGGLRMAFVHSATIERADLIGPTGMVVFTIAMGVIAMTPDEPD